MIQSQKDLERYLETERLLYLHRNYGIGQLDRKKPKLFGEYEWKFVRSLRWVEYAQNAGGGSKILCFLHKVRYKILKIVFFANIPPNVFEEGLLIEHLHAIEISSNVRVGRLCCLFHNTTMGISVGTDDHGECPVIGDGVTICTGVVIVGNVKVADGVTIAANATVSKNVDKSGCLIGGVPAKIIKEKAGFSMQEYWEKIRNKG